MRCPACGKENTRVIDSRPAEDDTCIRRRRACDECGNRFTTYERIQQSSYFVVKKDGTRELYNREKLETGINLACHKRRVSKEEIEELINYVEGQVFGSEEKEVHTAVIGELVMEKLKMLDPVAYVRFASVYREFTDADVFVDELGRALKERDGQHEKED
ncbi:MAG: transcriptional regulator NrdR [Lachnospiraceae bacterium]|nr:transcriptional regulator NrdR [Lachnospiraceae bacterium]MDY5742612.1 transcriptional regulator NrdR [Lachnospiraceae bacterium]